MVFSWGELRRYQRLSVHRSPGSMVCRDPSVSQARVSLVVQWLGVRLAEQGHGFYPWLGKIPRGTEQLNPGHTTTEPAAQ